MNLTPKQQYGIWLNRTVQMLNHHHKLKDKLYFKQFSKTIGKYLKDNKKYFLPQHQPFVKTLKGIKHYIDRKGVNSIVNRKKDFTSKEIMEMI